MNWYDPLDNSPPIISPSGISFSQEEKTNVPYTINERLIIFETRAGIPYAKGNYQLSEYPSELPSFLNRPKIYSIEGRTSISLVEGGYGAPSAVDVFETAIVVGCQSLFIFGLIGGIADHLKVGDIIIPTEVFREEGTSYHYAQPEQKAEPDKNLLNKLLYFLHQQDQFKVVQGKTVSTDAPFRQTLNKERNWQERGVLGVDMETSALFTVALYHQVPAVCLLIVSDKHNLQPNMPWEFGGEDFTQKRNLAIDLFIDFVRTH